MLIFDPGTSAENSARFRRWGGNPFALEQNAAYLRWREAKLADYPASADGLLVEIENAADVSPSEHARVSEICARTNMVLFHDAGGQLTDRQVFRSFAARFGLEHLSPHMLADSDGIASITPTSKREIKSEYIPYTTRALNWHTDGYYGTGGETIKGFALYCLRAADSGGESAMIDPEIIYIRLRDENPEHIAAFSRPDAMTIPANVRDDIEIRPESTGPVFSTDAATGQLAMRYTARTVSIVWPDDDQMNAARAALDNILASAAVFRYTLRPGDGLLCNNVLHGRSAFSDPERLIYRGRYLDRVVDPSIEAE
jgi:alpha-ketoglutarate-dependent taurine dioxygenase